MTSEGLYLKNIDEVVHMAMTKISYKMKFMIQLRKHQNGVMEI